jgi:hypothetical protein
MALSVDADAANFMLTVGPASFIETGDLHFGASSLLLRLDYPTKVPKLRRMVWPLRY